MIRGIYTAAAGMMTIQELTATTANNLANVETVGFKSDLMQFISAPGIHTWRVGGPPGQGESSPPEPEYIGLTNAGTMDTRIWRDFDQGQLTFTGNPLDVAINGDGFFRVVDEQGTETYTRDGQFKRDVNGFVVDNLGRRLQGLGGDINLGANADYYVNNSGDVVAGEQVLATINLAYFTDPQNQLGKLERNAWTSTTSPDGVGNSDFRSGYLERSNVDVITAMTDLIAQLRHYQANDRVVRAEDDTLNIAVNQVGKLPQ